MAALPIGAHLGVGTPDAKMLAVIPDGCWRCRSGSAAASPMGAGPLDPLTA